MSDQGIPPGWYPNPENPAEERYWAGYSWTEHIRPAGHAGFGSGLRSAGDTVGDSFKLMGTHWRGYLGVILVTLVPAVVIAAAGFALFITNVSSTWLDDFADNEQIDRTYQFDQVVENPALLIGGGLVLGVLFFLAIQLWWLATFHQAYWQLSGRPPTVGQSIRHAVRRTPRVVGVSILLGLIVIAVVLIGVMLVVAAGPVGVIIVVLGALPAAFFWTVYSPLCIGVAAIGPRVPSLPTGWQLATQNFWGVLGRLLLTALVTIAISLGGQIAYASGGALPAVVGAILVGIVGVSLQIVQSLLQTIVGVVIYHDLGGPVDDTAHETTSGPDAR